RFACSSLVRTHQMNLSSTRFGTIALGSDRAAKIMAVRAALARVAAIVPAWPLTDGELMQGARERPLAVCALLKKLKLDADLYVGLEGGFHSVEIDGK